MSTSNPVWRRPERIFKINQRKHSTVRVQRLDGKFEGEEEDQTQILLMSACKRARVSIGQFEKSHLGNDGAITPFLALLNCRKCNLDGCYQNESEERHILRTINIQLKSAEKWQMWFRSDFSLRLFWALSPQVAPTPVFPSRHGSIGECRYLSQCRHLGLSTSLHYNPP